MVVAFSGNDESCPSLGGKDMNDVTRRAASEMLAQMLALTAMLVIAGVVILAR